MNRLLMVTPEPYPQGDFDVYGFECRKVRQWYRTYVEYTLDADKRIAGHLKTLDSYAKIFPEIDDHMVYFTKEDMDLMKEKLPIGSEIVHVTKAAETL